MCSTPANMNTLRSATATPPPMIATRPRVCMVVCIRRLAAASIRPALPVNPRHRLHRHGVGDHILDDVAGRG